MDTYPMPIKHRRNSTTGQAMIFATIAIGATVLASATIAGLLILYQLRQAGDFSSSAVAIFAADAGTEFGLYNFYQSSTTYQEAPPTLRNDGVNLVVDCLDDRGDIVDCGIIGDSNAVLLRALGTYRGTTRAFLLQLDVATSTFP